LILLVAAALLSQLLGETTDAVIITLIVLASGVLGFFQERGAVHAVNSLLASVQVRCRVVRDGATVNAPILSVVRGDVVLLSAGDVVPGDCRVLEANNLLVDESTLTGEAYPAAKVVTAVPADAELADRDSVVHLGSHVASGTGTVVVVDTGAATEFGAVSAHLATRHVPTSFERGVTSFGLLLLRATAVLTPTTCPSMLMRGPPELPDEIAASVWIRRFLWCRSFGHGSGNRSTKFITCTAGGSCSRNRRASAWIKLRFLSLARSRFRLARSMRSPIRSTPMQVIRGFAVAYAVRKWPWPQPISQRKDPSPFGKTVESLAVRARRRSSIKAA
ncbi:MAG: magnesium-translocating P-type ATPase, partial [Verrucomicrobiota bacterium]